MSDEFLTYAGAAAICVLVFAHVFWRTRQGGFLVIDPLNMFWGGIIVCYVVQPIAYFDQISEFQPTGDIPGALVWILGGLICVIAGYESRLGTTMGRVVPPGPACLGRWRLAFLGLVSIVAGVAGYSYEISTAGGVKAWLAVPRGGTDWEVASSYVVLLTTLLPIGVALWLFAAEFGRGPALARAAAWVCGLLLLGWFIYLGTRSRSILWVITLLTAYYLPRRRNPPLALIVFLFPLLLVGSSFLVQNRDRFTDLSLNLSLQEASERWHSAAREALGFGEQGYRREIQAGLEFNYVLAAIELVPAPVPYTYGYNLLEILTRPIPRAIWENKRYPSAEAFTPLLEAGGLSSTWVTTSVEPVLMGPAPTFAGFWWAVGGPVALFAGGAFTGMILRAIRAIYDRSEGTNQSDVIVYWSLLSIGFVEAAATPLSWVFSLPLVVIPLVILLRFASVRGRMPA